MSRLLSTHIARLSRASTRFLCSLPPHSLIRKEVRHPDGALRTIEVAHNLGDHLIGGRIWPAAQVLISHLESTAGSAARVDREDQECTHLFSPVGKSVCELGSGTGVCGLAAAALGAERVVLTDCKPDVLHFAVAADGTPDPVLCNDSTVLLQLLRHNIDLSISAGSVVRGQVDVCELMWGRNDHVQNVLTKSPRGVFDLVIGSDLTYTSGGVRDLLSTLSTLADACTEANDGTGLRVALASQSRFGVIHNEFSSGIRHRFEVLDIHNSENVYLFLCVAKT